MTGFGSIRCAPLQGGATLPVRIRDASGTVIVESVSGREIDVPPGSYYVGALLPDGNELLTTEAVEVVAGRTVEAALDLFEPEAPPMPVAGEVTAGQAMLTARRWRGDWLAGLAGDATGDALEEAGFLGEPLELAPNRSLVIERDYGFDDLLVVEHGGKRSIHILPLDECIACIDQSSDGRSIGVRVHPVGDLLELRFSSTISTDTNMFLDFIDHGLLAESRAISSDILMRGEAALRAPQSSLLRAVLGAYVLLRANRLEGLDHWIDQLIEAAPHMPDGHALQAEALARVGDHDGAMDALRRGLNMPCPWFRSGLSYSLERLRLYLDVHGEPKVGFSLPERVLEAFVARKTVLERAAARLDTTAIFATFRERRRPWQSTRRRDARSG